MTLDPRLCTRVFQRELVLGEVPRVYRPFLHRSPGLAGSRSQFAVSLLSDSADTHCVPCLLHPGERFRPLSSQLPERAATPACGSPAAVAVAAPASTLRASLRKRAELLGGADLTLATGNHGLSGDAPRRRRSGPPALVTHGVPRVGGLPIAT